MPIYAALMIDFKGVREEVVHDALREAIDQIGGYVVDATLSGMIIEGGAVTLTMAEYAITDALDAIVANSAAPRSSACSPWPDAPWLPVERLTRLAGMRDPRANRRPYCRRTGARRYRSNVAHAL